MWRDRETETYVEIERLDQKANNAFALLARITKAYLTLFKSKSVRGSYRNTAVLRDADTTLTAEIERLEARARAQSGLLQIGNNVINRKNSELDKANACYVRRLNCYTVNGLALPYGAWKKRRTWTPQSNNAGMYDPTKRHIQMPWCRQSDDERLARRV